VAPWLAASAAAGFPANTLDLSIAPFRLLAIVNRVDLRQGTTYGGIVNNTAVPAALGGEARFVFGVTDPSGAQLNFTVILEYAVPARTCDEVKKWAVRWANLDTLTLPSAAFNNALQLITDDFATANKDPSRPNKSAIHQVRANDFLGSQWALRQFNIDNGAGGNPGFLVQTPVAATPALSLNDSATLNKFILAVSSPASFCPNNASPPGLTIPAFYNGAAFAGGWAPEGFMDIGGTGIVWDSDNPTTLTGSQLCVRHILSLNTCNSCHTLETGTSFTHVFPRGFNQASQLSGFLLGGASFIPGEKFTVPDFDFNDNPGVFYNYADLSRRIQDLWQCVNCPCPFDVIRPLLKFEE